MKIALTIVASVVATLTVYEMANRPSIAGDVHGSGAADDPYYIELPAPGLNDVNFPATLSATANLEEHPDPAIAAIQATANDVFKGQVVNAYLEKWGVNPIAIRNAEVVELHGRHFLRGDGEYPGQTISVAWDSVVGFETTPVEEASRDEDLGEAGWPAIHQVVEGTAAELAMKASVLESQLAMLHDADPTGDVATSYLSKQVARYRALQKKAEATAESLGLESHASDPDE